jgi:hypothetical protein
MSRIMRFCDRLIIPKKLRERVWISLFFVPYIGYMVLRMFYDEMFFSVILYCLASVVFLLQMYSAYRDTFYYQRTFLFSVTVTYIITVFLVMLAWRY